MSAAGDVNVEGCRGVAGAQVRGQPRHRVDQLGRRIVARVAQQDVRSRHAACVEPQIVRRRLPKRQAMVFPPPCARRQLGGHGCGAPPAPSARPLACGAAGAGSPPRPAGRRSGARRPVNPPAANRPPPAADRPAPTRPVESAAEPDARRASRPDSVRSRFGRWRRPILWGRARAAVRAPRSRRRQPESHGRAPSKAVPAARAAPISAPVGASARSEAIRRSTRAIAPVSGSSTRALTVSTATEGSSAS